MSFAERGKPDPEGEEGIGLSLDAETGFQFLRAGCLTVMALAGAAVMALCVGFYLYFQKLPGP
ncbi:MAG TPA: hypothetical protein VF535_04305 [Allosphingosinicella sp.]